MAKIIKAQAVYEVVDTFRDNCIKNGKSLLWPLNTIWTSDNISVLTEAIKGADSRNFLGKLNNYVSPLSKDVHRMIADTISFYYLFPTDTGKRAKLRSIEKVVSWKLADDEPDFTKLKVAFSESKGIGAGGQLYRLQKVQIEYFLAVFKEIIDRKFRMDDFIKFKLMANEVSHNIKQSEPGRNILLHLFFPDNFERISSGRDKSQIVKVFKDKSEGAQDKDDALANIRKALIKELGRPDIDFFDNDIVKRWRNVDIPPTDPVILLLVKKKQVILYGPPGTGKTHITKKIATELLSNNQNVAEQYKEYKSEGQIEFITFHPTYSYEDFIEGLTVDAGATTSVPGSIKYIMKAGIFKRLCTRALNAALEEELKRARDKVPGKSLLWQETFNKYKDNIEDKKEFWEKAPKFALIIDEINRGDISKIFGELITLLESDKRLGEENELTSVLPLSGEEFGVPPNIYIIATMNTADRSIALIDIALRRRFGFHRMDPDFELIEKQIDEANADRQVLMHKSLEALQKINSRIEEDKGLGRDKLVGHSYLWGLFEEMDIAFAWNYDILPLIEEYCCGDIEKMTKIVFNGKNNNYFDERHVPYDELDDFLDEVIATENNYDR